MGLSATAGNPQKSSRPNRRKAVRTLFLSPHPGHPGAALLKTHDGIVHSARSGHTPAPQTPGSLWCLRMEILLREPQHGLVLRRPAWTNLPNRKRRWWATNLPPPGIPTGFCPKAQGCAAEALPWVHSHNINNPNGVVPGHHAGRLPARARIRRNGQREMALQHLNPPCAGQPTRSYPRHNHVVVVAPLPRPPGVVRPPAQPRAVWHNVVDVGEGKPWMDANPGGMVQRR